MAQLNEADQAIFNSLIDPDQVAEARYPFDDDFLRVLLGILLSNRFFHSQCTGLIKATYFRNEIHQVVCRLLFNYFDKYKQLPSKIFMKQLLDEHLKGRHQNDDKYRAVKIVYLAELNLIYDYYTKGGSNLMPTLDNPEAILDKITSFARTQAVKTAWANSVELIKRNPEAEETWNKIDELYKEARLVNRNFDIGLDYFASPEERYAQLANSVNEDEMFDLGGFRSIRKSLVGGGLARRELGAVMGLAGRRKCFITGTSILMYDGSTKKIENIEIGDLVMGDDSTPRKVLNTHAFWDDAYEIRPVKGKSYYVNSHHVLSLKKRHVIENISVEDWLKQSKHFKKEAKGWRTGVEWPNKDTKISPYLLGAWLASSKREEIAEKIGIDSKYIPFDYKVNSRAKRMELLAGLIDYGGFKRRCGYEFVNKNKVLVNDVVFLARSLGFAAYVGRKRNSCRVSISGDCVQIPVRLEYKRCNPRKQIKDVLVTGIKVIRKGVKARFYGFETDGNHLFLMSDFTVVHNSLWLAWVSVQNVLRGKKVLYISTEMDQPRIASRFDSMFSRISQNDLLAKQNEVWEALREHVSSYEDKRRLVIKQFPSGTADINAVRAYHSQLTMMGFKPDLVIVDYPGDFKDYAGLDLWHSRYRMLREIRGFGVEENHCTLIAVHPNRSSKDLTIEEFMDEGNMGDSFKQSQVLDFFFTINQSDVEKAASVARGFIAKARNGVSRVKFWLKFDFKTLALREISKHDFEIEMTKHRDAVVDGMEVDVNEVLDDGHHFKPNDGELQT